MLGKLRDAAVQLLPESIRVRHRRRRHLGQLLARIEADLAPVSAHPHDLPGELIVSLTSYPARFADLHLTIASLLNQTVAPNRVVLWVAGSDAKRLPDRVRRLCRDGLSLRTVPDVRSYKKLVFALTEFPKAFIATADDDLFYKPTWLAELIKGHGGEPVINCHRAHRFSGVENGMAAPYRDWDWEVSSPIGVPCVDLMPTGVAGVLYPPGSLHPDVTDARLFRTLAPTADDLWFYWMARRAGTRIRKVSSSLQLTTWPGTQDAALFRENLAPDGSGNDRQVANLVRAFGDPIRL